METIDLDATQVTEAHRHGVITINDEAIDDDDVIFVSRTISSAPVIVLEEDSVADRRPRCGNGAAAASTAGARAAANVNDTLNESRGASLICPICMDSVKANSPHSTICGHIFCGDCIKQAIRLQKKCPMCKKAISAKQIHPIYLC